MRCLRAWIAVCGAIAAGFGCHHDDGPLPQECNSDCYEPELDEGCVGPGCDEAGAVDEGSESTGSECTDPDDAPPCHPSCAGDSHCGPGERCVDITGGLGTCEPVPLLPACSASLAFEERELPLLPVGVSWLFAIQADEDPGEEVVIVDSIGQFVLVDPHDGSVTPLDAPRPEHLTGVIAGDFDGDGAPELLAADGANALHLWSRDAGGMLVRGEIANPFGEWVQPMTTLDWNADGMLDIAGLALGTQVIALLGDGVGGFAEAEVVYEDPSFAPWSATSGRFSDDALEDLALPTDRTLIAVGGGMGILDVTPNDGSAVSLLAAIDFDADGRDELVGSGYLNGWAAIDAWTVGLATHERHAVALDPWALEVGQVDADAVPDLAVAGPTDLDGTGPFDVAFVLGQAGRGPGVLSCVQTFSPGASPAGLGDFNGDGRIDVVGVTTAMPRLMLWLAE
jgi:hypothetical protein